MVKVGECFSPSFSPDGEEITGKNAMKRFCTGSCGSKNEIGG